MSIVLPCLLRLPACLRRQALQEALPQKQCHVNSQLASCARQASSSSRLPPSRQKPVPGLKKPPAPKAASRPPARPAAPLPPRSSQSGGYRAVTYADQLLQGADQVLLYKAPNHRSFKFLSYTVGGVLIFGAYTWMQILGSMPPTFSKKAVQSWKKYLYLTMTYGTGLFMAAMGTALILAPTRMIKSIALVAKSAAAGGKAAMRAPALRCEMENPVPFLKPKFFDREPSEALLDRNVQAVEIDLTSIPLSKAKDFTSSGAKSRIAGPPKLPGGAIARAWATFGMDIRRAFYREGIAYIRWHDYGNWKLDLQHCELLDQGRPLDRLTTFDVKRGVGPVAWVRRMVGRD